MFRVFTGFLLLMFLPLFAAHCGSQNKAESDNIGKPVPDAAHNSQNSLDWAGTYVGTTPCADCPGIETRLTLSYEETYELTTRYIGKSENLFKKAGSFSWNETGNKVTLHLDSNTRPAEYLVQENRVIQLDMNGKKITGDLADSYVLEKLSD